MTRLWPEGNPIIVLTSGSDGSPSRFTWRGQAHPVKEITRKWRVDLDWWRQQVRRDYFKLTTRTGLLVIIYHDLRSGQWYLQRLYD